MGIVRQNAWKDYFYRTPANGAAGQPEVLFHPLVRSGGGWP